MKKDTILKLIATVLVSSALAVGFVLAGTLNPTGAPAASLKTLEDIYLRLTDGTAAPAHNLYPAQAAAGTMYTLDQIYSAVPAGSAILNSVNPTFGTANTPPGSGVAATNGEVLSDYYAFKADGTTLTGSATAASAPLTWHADTGDVFCWSPVGSTTCEPGGSGALNLYGGTFGDNWGTDAAANLSWACDENVCTATAGSVVRDPDDNSIWQCTVSHSGASILGTFTQEKVANPNTWRQISLFGASEYCKYLNSDGATFNCTGDAPDVVCTQVNYWRLPTAFELAAAIATTFYPIDGTSTPGGTPGGFTASSGYWSSSQADGLAYVLIPPPSISDFDLIPTGDSFKLFRCVH